MIVAVGVWHAGGHDVIKFSFYVDRDTLSRKLSFSRYRSYTRYSMSDCIKIFWCWTFTQHRPTSFYLTSYVTDMNYITHRRFFISLINWSIDILLEFWCFCRSSEHRFSPCLHPELSTTRYDHSIVTYKFQYSWRVWTLPVQGRDCDSCM